MFELEIIKKFSAKEVADLLCSALESGSYCPYRIEEYIAPKEEDLYKWDADFFNEDGSPTVFEHVQFPMSPGGALILSVPEDDDGKTYRLDLPAIKKGLQVWAETCPYQFGNFMNDNADAITALEFLDVVLQGKPTYA